MPKEKFMELALEKAKESLKRGEYPVGCVIVKDDKVVGKGSNRGRTSNDITAHAEILAIKDACENLGTRFLEGCSVYTTVEPCLMCAQAAVYAKIDKVVYGTELGEYGEKNTFDILKENGIGEDIEVQGGFLSKRPLNCLISFWRKILALKCKLSDQPKVAGHYTF